MKEKEAYQMINQIIIKFVSEIQSHISKNEKYKCTDCIEEYITRPEFNDHLKTHTLINSTASADEKSVRDT
jgi:hypothetical protein